MSDRLRRSISGLLDSGRYFDAKIECGGETFHVHKSVVCTQSEYFARVFDENNGFKGVIGCIPSHHFSIARPVLLISDGNITATAPHSALFTSTTAHFQRSNAPRDFTFWDRQPLLTMTQEGQTSSIELKDIEASTVRAMIEFMYHGGYKTTEENEIMLNIDVYATAEMYQVEGLKDIAAQHFKVVVPSFFDLPTFPDAIRAIYQGTMEEDRGLRDVLVETAAGKIDELIKDPVFNAVLEEVGAFGKHLIHTIHVVAMRGALIAALAEE
ncbi:BTB/POZ protein [Phyllosticta capitalensis]